MNFEEKILTMLETITRDINELKESQVKLEEEILHNHKLTEQTKDATSIMGEQFIKVKRKLDDLTLFPDYVLKSDNAIRNIIIDRHTREIEDIQSKLDTHSLVINAVIDNK